MLTKEDIEQLRVVVRDEIRAAEVVTRSDLTKFATKAELAKSTSEILRHIRDSQNAIIAFFDDRYIDLRERVERLENAMGLPPLGNGPH